jgi:hypothetical protein
MEVELLFITRHIVSGAESLLRCNWSKRSFAASGKSGEHDGNETDTAADTRNTVGSDHVNSGRNPVRSRDIDNLLIRIPILLGLACRV